VVNGYNFLNGLKEGGGVLPFFLDNVAVQNIKHNIVEDFLGFL
jgi:hypothetical protein